MLKQTNNDNINCATCDNWYAEETYDGDTFPYCEKHHLKLNPYEWDCQVCEDWKDAPEPSGEPHF